MKIQDLCNLIDQILDEYATVKRFKIGKTDNLENREEDYHEKGYNFIHPLYTGEKEEISQAEKDLIKYFTETSRHKNKCTNKQEGGGSPDATMLYLAIEKEDASINDLNIKELILDKYFSNQQQNKHYEDKNS